LTTDGAQGEKVKKPITKWVQKTSMKQPTLDLQKQKETFLQVRQDWTDQGTSSSSIEDKKREPMTISLRSNPCVEEV
jgi:hypothetical protein